MSRPRRKGFFRSCIPNEFGVALGTGDVSMFAEFADDGKRRRFVTIRRVGIPEYSRKAAKKDTDRIVDADGESWNSGDFNYVLFIWDRAKRKGAPDGFLTVAIDVFYSNDNKGDRINRIHVTPQVAYVRKKKRRCGLGKWLAATFNFWVEPNIERRVSVLGRRTNEKIAPWPVRDYKWDGGY